MDKPCNWVNYIFNPKFGFVHILPKIGFKQECESFIQTNFL